MTIAEKCEFTKVNDHLEDKRNEEVGLYRQTLIKFDALLSYLLIIGKNIDHIVSFF